MKTHAFFPVALACAFALALPVQAAQDKTSAMPAGHAMASADMTSGEIRKIDKENKKLTIKHGDIKNLDMPGMTMVFQVKDPAMLDKVKVGDKIQFAAEKSGGALVVTDLVPSK